MRAVVQRVTEAEVRVDGEVVGAIGPGLCALVGVTHDDTPDEAAKLAAKLFHLRVFDDADGVMNRSLADTGAQPWSSASSRSTATRAGAAAELDRRGAARARRAAGGRGGA